MNKDENLDERGFYPAELGDRLEDPVVQPHLVEREDLLLVVIFHHCLQKPQSPTRFSISTNCKPPGKNQSTPKCSMIVAETVCPAATTGPQTTVEAPLDRIGMGAALVGGYLSH